MKTKQEHIKFWMDQSNDDWDAVETLFSGKKYIQSLFFAHLVIEKICKAIWIKHNVENIPPKSHNLIYLLSSTKIDIPDDLSEFLLSLNRFQLEGRYPEYLTKINELCNKQFTSAMLEKTNKFRLWLIEKLQ